MGFVTIFGIFPLRTGKQCSRFACNRLQATESTSPPNPWPKLYFVFMIFIFAPLHSSWISFLALRKAELKTRWYVAFISQMVETVCGSQQFLGISQCRGSSSCQGWLCFFPTSATAHNSPVPQKAALKGEGMCCCETLSCHPGQCRWGPGVSLAGEGANPGGAPKKKVSLMQSFPST